MQKQKGVTHVIAILIIAALLLIGFLLYQNVINVEVFDDSSILPSPNLQGSQIDETSNWKIFKDNDVGFEFKYPPHMSDAKRIPLRDSTYILASAENETLAVMQKKHYDENLGKNLDYDKFIMLKTPETRQLINLGSYYGIKYQQINALDTINMQAVLTKDFRDDLITEISYSNHNKEFVDQATFDKILSTFKFTESPKNDTGIEGKFCGGIAGIICPEGYTCILDGNYPDASGKCTKAEVKTN